MGTPAEEVLHVSGIIGQENPKGSMPRNRLAAKLVLRPNPRDVTIDGSSAVAWRGSDDFIMTQDGPSKSRME